MLVAQGRPGTVDGGKREATVYAFPVICMAEGLGNKLGRAILQLKKDEKEMKRNVCASPSYMVFFLQDGKHS